MRELIEGVVYRSHTIAIALSKDFTHPEIPLQMQQT
jgi:hypothetical protein